MIKILILTISVFLLIFLESFLLKVFSFSIFVVISISLWKRVGDIWFYLFITIGSLVLDTVLHMPLGLHMLVLGILIVLLEFFLLLIPRDGRFGYIHVFFFVFFYYLSILLLSSFLQDFVFPKILLTNIVEIVLKSFVSVFLCVLIDKSLVTLRDSGGESNIKLR